MASWNGKAYNLNQEENNMFEIEGKNYTLRYNIRRIELIESATQESMMAELKRTNCLLSLRTLKTYFSYGLQNESGNYISPKEAESYAEKLIQSEGYAKLDEAVISAIQNDCPFFFQAG
jgi:hypothetical protein